MVSYCHNEPETPAEIVQFLFDKLEAEGWPYKAVYCARGCNCYQGHFCEVCDSRRDMPHKEGCTAVATLARIEGYLKQLDEHEQQQAELPDIEEGDKLYLVTRRDLPPGSQAVQAAHAMRKFKADFPLLEQRWYERSNTLAFLSVATKADLETLLEKAGIARIEVSRFHEPDLGHELTALALSPFAQKLLRHVPLALSKAPQENTLPPS